MNLFLPKGHKLMSVRIDEQLTELLSQLLQTNSQYHLENKCLVELLYYGFTIIVGTPTPGMQAMDLSVKEEKYNKIALLISLVVKYLFLKIQSMANSVNQFDDILRRVNSSFHGFIKTVDVSGKIFEFFSFLLFLSTGDFPSLLYRISNIDLIAVSSNNGTVSTGFKSSQLYIESRKILWYTIISLGSALLISVDWKDLKYFLFLRIHRFFSYIKSSNISKFMMNLIRRWMGLRAANNNNDNNNININTNNRINIIRDNNFCCHCESIAENPHSPVCGHVFCYLCLHSIINNKNGDDSNNNNNVCPICTESIITYFPCNV